MLNGVENLMYAAFLAPTDHLFYSENDWPALNAVTDQVLIEDYP